MRECPALFSRSMVRALFNDKTETRRVVKPKWGGTLLLTDGVLIESKAGQGPRVRLPPWKVGDRLWVREAYRAKPEYDDLPPRAIPQCSPVRYEADEGPPFRQSFGKLRPAMFMPRWMSRLQLDVVEVRVERLQEVTNEAARAEGVLQWAADIARDPEFSEADVASLQARYGTGELRFGYAALWDSINGVDGDCCWFANPHVFVTRFRRVNP